MTRLPRLHAGQSIARISQQIRSHLGRCLASLEVRLAEESLEGAVAKPTIRQSAMGRPRLLTVGYPARIAISGAIVFLASDAAAMVTGAALMVDGGWTAA